MELKKKNFLLMAFVVFWVILIAWGIIKTAGKLSQKKPALSKTSKTEPQSASNEPAKNTEEKTSDKKSSGSPTAGGSEEKSANAPEAATSIQVRTVRANTTDFQDILPVMGSSKGKTEIELKFEINGVIQKINFREGEKVKTGELIATINPEDTKLKLAYTQNKLASAEAAYNSAKKKLEVHKSLFEAGAIIKSKMEEVELEAESGRFQVETARSEMKLAENELTKTSLYATKDGLMGPREAEEGEFVTPQDKVASLFEISEMFVEVGVVERDIDKIKAGQKAKIYVDAYSDKTFEGAVKYIFPIVEGKSRTLTVKIAVPNPEQLLLPGMFCRAEISIVDLKDALIIPFNAISNVGGGVNIVPIILKDLLKTEKDETQTGTVKLQRVKLGYTSTDYAQVLEGLTTGDLVVIETQGELTEDARVKIVGIEELSF